MMSLREERIKCVCYIFIRVYFIDLSVLGRKKIK